MHGGEWALVAEVLVLMHAWCLLRLFMSGDGVWGCVRGGGRGGVGLTGHGCGRVLVGMAVGGCTRGRMTLPSNFISALLSSLVSTNVGGTVPYSSSRCPMVRADWRTSGALLCPNRLQAREMADLEAIRALILSFAGGYGNFDIIMTHPY